MLGTKLTFVRALKNFCLMFVQSRFTLLKNAVWLLTVPDRPCLLELHVLGMNGIFALLCNSLFLVPYVLIPNKARKEMNTMI